METTINKEDYSIAICFDKNGETYWNLSCKGQSKFATKEELLMISETLGLIKKRIDLRIDFELIKEKHKKQIRL